MAVRPLSIHWHHSGCILPKVTAGMEDSGKTMHPNLDCLDYRCSCHDVPRTGLRETGKKGNGLLRPITR